MTSARQAAGWDASRVVVPGTESQLGAPGLFVPPPGDVAVETSDGALRVRAADADVLWLDFDEVVRAASAGIDWAALAAGHAVWVVSDVPVLAEAPRGAAAAFGGLAEVLHAADVPLVVIAPLDPGPMRRPLPVDQAHDGGLPRLSVGS